MHENTTKTPGSTCRVSITIKVMTRHISFFLLLFAGVFGQFGVAKKPVGKAVPQPPESLPEAASNTRTPREFPIDSITVEGNRILTADGIAAASGLKLGAKGDTTAFNAARDRLLGTGYFETVAYRFKAAE